MPYYPYGAPQSYPYGASAQPLDHLGALRAQQAAQQGGINWVQGVEAAKGYFVLPGNSVLLLDSEAQCFYIKSVDASGVPAPLRVFDYTERTATPAPSPQPAPEITAMQEELKALTERIKTLELARAPRKSKAVIIEDDTDA